MAFRWRADDGPLLVVIVSSIPWSTKINVNQVGPPLKKLSGSAHALIVLWLFMLCDSSSRCRGFVCGLRLWHFLVIHVCVLALTQSERSVMSRKKWSVPDIVQFGTLPTIGVLCDTEPSVWEVYDNVLSCRWILQAHGNSQSQASRL